MDAELVDTEQLAAIQPELRAALEKVDAELNEAARRLAAVAVVKTTMRGYAVHLDILSVWLPPDGEEHLCLGFGQEGLQFASSSCCVMPISQAPMKVRFWARTQLQKLADALHAEAAKYVASLDTPASTAMTTLP